MKIGIYHGYELTGSGSNEYTRYLAKNLAESGHEIHIICREPNPEQISFLSKAYKWDIDGAVKEVFSRQDTNTGCFLHQLPHNRVRPVYLTDKQRDGEVKSFISLTKTELEDYHNLNEKLLHIILLKIKLDILHANHLIYQPVAALDVCKLTDTPLIIYPHGSSIEYVLKFDDRYKKLALKAILGCSGLIIGNEEVRDRITKIYPDFKDTILAKTKIVGVGVDTNLFKPIENKNREKNIQELINLGGKGGKSPEVTKKVYVRLQKFDINSTRDYWNRYDHSLPDADLKNVLKQIPWNENILLFVGALTVGKGLQSLITALPAILDQQPKTHLVIVGDGSYREVLEALIYAIKTSDELLLSELCKKGKDLDRNDLAGPWEDVQHYLNNPDNISKLLKFGKNLDKHVHFLGRLDHSRLKFVFPCADVAVFPSVIPEAYPLVVMESLANGVIPVVTYFSGFKDGLDELESFLGKDLIDRMKISINPDIRIESIISNISGLLSEPGLNKYSSKLRQMAIKKNDRKIKASLRQMAIKKNDRKIKASLREIAVENYDWKKRASQMVDAYSTFTI